jgi:allantoinase
MDNPLYDYSPIVARPPLALPGGARVAVWVGVNVEHYAWGQPALSLAPFTAELVPDPTNYGWRDYGPRVGLWRLAEILERHGFPVSAITNSEVLDRYPEIVEEGRRRDWAWVAHGKNNSTWHVGMERDAEVELVGGIAERFEAATGRRPRGWLGPALTSTMNTTAVLAELGFSYTLDWAVDDQPFDMRVPSGRLLAVPYSSEINDIPLCFLHHQSGAGLRDAIVDQLYAEGADTPRVLGIGLHPFIAGQAFRAKHVAEALEHIAGHADVWRTTSDAIAAWYLEAVPA